jgi:hypothetical protein
MRVTRYFLDSVLRRRPELVDMLDRIEEALREPVHTEKQPDGRIRHWIYIPERDRYLRVIVEPDGETVHNAFLDRGFKEK